MRKTEINTLSLDQIVVSQGRKLDPDVVASMAESIKSMGLQNPINVLATGEGGYRIISGRHRLAAVRSLGRDQIEALVRYDLSDIEVRLAEIVENLHRAELTALQRSDQIVEYAKLVKERRKEGAAQVGQHLSNVKGASRREAGDSAAARDLGLSRQAIQRAEKIANISPEAKAAVKEAGLDDNQSALLDIAAAPKEQQQVVITELVDKRARKRSNPRSGKDVNATVQAILVKFGDAEVQAIITALSTALAGRCADLLSKSQTVAAQDGEVEHAPFPEKGTRTVSSVIPFKGPAEAAGGHPAASQKRGRGRLTSPQDATKAPGGHEDMRSCAVGLQTSYPAGFTNPAAHGKIPAFSNPISVAHTTKSCEDSQANMSEEMFESQQKEVKVGQNGAEMDWEKELAELKKAIDDNVKYEDSLMANCYRNDCSAEELEKLEI